MLSATVGSPICACHFSTGNWLVNSANRVRQHSSQISTKARRFVSAGGPLSVVDEEQIYLAQRRNLAS
jgi:hypothetical protein